MIALTGLIALSACSQKPSSEEISKQVKIALEEAEKAKQETPSATAERVTAPHVAARTVSTPKHLPKPKAVEKSSHAEEAKPVPTAAVSEKAICTNCGVVLSVNERDEEGKGSGLGAVAGAVTGGLIGNQVGQGTGKDVATLVGVFGGAIAGDKIEKHVKKTKIYDISIRMDNGTERVLSQSSNPNIKTGDKVKVENEIVAKQ